MSIGAARNQLGGPAQLLPGAGLGESLFTYIIHMIITCLHFIPSSHVLAFLNEKASPRQGIFCEEERFYY
jgi:hypothetical protein